MSGDGVNDALRDRADRINKLCAKSSWTQSGALSPSATSEHSAKWGHRLSFPNGRERSTYWVRPPVPQGFPLIISKTKGGIPHFSLSPSSLCTDCPDVCNNHCMHEPCITWSFKGVQKLTCKLTRKLMGTCKWATLQIMILRLNFKHNSPFSPTSFPLNNKVLWDQARILYSYSPPQISLSNPENRNGPKKVILKSFGQVWSPTQTPGFCQIPAAMYVTLGLDPGNSCTCL